MLTAERLPRSGKVRDIYELPDRRLVLVASDRISAFDVILPTPIPDKGRVLTGLSRFWFDATRSIIRNHLLDTEVGVVVDGYGALLEAHGQAPRDLIPEGGFDAWRGRLMVCWPAQVIPIEAVVRGYLSGSAWKEYRETGRVCGIELPPGLRESDRLPEAIFTPASKAPAGRHDENLTFDAAIDHIARHVSRSFVFGRGAAPETFDIELPTLPREQAGEIAEAVRDAAIRLYRYGAASAARAGILVADTKFEFGLPTVMSLEPSGPPTERIGRRPSGNVLDDAVDSRSMGGRLMLIDEVLTPDSSRFWDAAAYAPGGPQASFDKQFVRDWLERQPWDKTAPGPELPDEVVAGTRARYVEAFERITGGSFDRYLAEDVIGPAHDVDEEAR
jgi:phosphoribosylaminoimidazole-succinocarboxamide synthase